MRLRKFYSIILAIFLLVLTIPGFSMMVGNATGKSFDEPDDGSGDNQQVENYFPSMTIESLVIEAATNFLKGKAHADWLAANIEASENKGYNLYELQTTVTDSLYYLRTARYYYWILTDKAERTPYNQEVIIQLKSFDYNALLKENGLNSDAFLLVQKYLESGDVRGAYAKLLAYTEDIIISLESIQNDLYRLNLPERQKMWKLNQECANMLLFGQYLSQVFYRIN